MTIQKYTFYSVHEGEKVNQAQFHLQCSRRNSKVEKS